MNLKHGFVDFRRVQHPLPLTNSSPPQCPFKPSSHDWILRHGLIKLNFEVNKFPCEALSSDPLSKDSSSNEFQNAIFFSDFCNQLETMIDTKISALSALGELVRKIRDGSSNDVSINGDSTIDGSTNDNSANGGSTNEGSAARKALKKPNFVIQQLKKNK
jgi:hypothetical protein